MEYKELSQAAFDSLQGRILYEDNHILVVDKAPGDIVQDDKTGDETLCDIYKAFIAQRDAKPGKVFLGIPHRLDRPVSGAVILAKTSKALERLAAMFREGNVHKTYWALTCKAPVPESGELRSFLIRDEGKNKSFVCRHPEGRKDAKEARMRYRLIGHTERYFLVEVELLTGRHHQIRCQLSSIGCPIKGDLKYGAPRSNKDGGICLHARNITFLHPVKKVEVDVTAPIPCSWPALPVPALPDTTLRESCPSQSGKLG